MFKRKPKDFLPERRTAKITTPTPVFSYRANRTRAEMPTGRYEEKSVSSPRRHYLINIPTYLALGLIIGSVVYAITLSTAPHLEIFSDGQPANLLRDKTVYEAEAHKILRRSPANWFKPTLDTARVATEMRQRFPELGSVNVNIPLVDRHPIIQVSFATPRLILRTNQGEFVVSDSGRAMVSTTELRRNANLQLPVVTDQTGLHIKQGDLALTPASVHFITTVTSELRAKGQPVESLTLPAVPEELDARLVGQPFTLKFNLLNDARQQAGTYLALRQKLESDRVTPGQYIDLRVEEHAYYK